MTTKHTPGPWAAEYVGDSGGENPMEVWEVVSSDGFSRVAEHLSAADARLVAFAPDLLAALKKARIALDGLPRSLGYDITHLRDIDAAIAKATGETK